MASLTVSASKTESHLQLAYRQREHEVLVFGQSNLQFIETVQILVHYSSFSSMTSFLKEK
jgi:hypothetical protein